MLTRSSASRRWLRPLVVGAAVLTLAAIVWVVVHFLTGIGGQKSQRVHPPGTVVGNEVPADRLSTAAFVTDLAIAPDGSVLYVEHLTGRIGMLRVAAGGALVDETVAQVALPELGRLMHLVLHPDWPVEPVIYVTAHEGEGELQRLALFGVIIDGDGSAEVERLVGDLPTEDPARGARADHYGSALAICGEYLYVSVGDTDSPGPGGYRPGGIRFRAQEPSSAEGKLLRYRVDGVALEPAGVFDSPYPVYALGLRNVFAMDCDPTTGWPVVADNGTGGYDQLRLVEPGSNHEWPRSDERDELTPPLFTSGRAAIAPTGIVARATEDGGTDLLFTGFHLESVYSLQVSADGIAADVPELLHHAGSAPLSLAGDSLGCVYMGTSDGIWLLREPGCDRVAGVPTEGASERFTGEPTAIYLANCSPCHGLSREGAEGPALLPDRLGKDDDFYISRILAGRPKRGMPSWAVAGMSEAQARAMLEYLRSASE